MGYAVSAAKSKIKAKGKPPHRFKKGQSGNPRGRKPGVPNKATIEAKLFCASVVDDEIYRRNLLKAARLRRLKAGVEQMLWHYAKGKPKEQVELTGANGAPLVPELIVRYLSPDDPEPVTPATEPIKEVP